MVKKTKNERIEIEVEKTLACLDEVERIEAGPHFLTRLLTRIRDLERGPKALALPVFIYRLLRPALLGLMIAINVILAVLMFDSGRSQAETRKDSISAMASYYGLQESDVDSLISYQ